MTSCVPRERIVYYQDIDTNSFSTNKFETIIKPDDLLMIIVSAQDPEAAAPYNLMTDLTVNPNNAAGGGQRQQQLYLVDQEGFVDFPILGKVEMGGKSKEEIVKNLQTLISKDIKNPIINLRIMNFKVTVNGEVNRPGVHTIASERITLPEALTLSGDLTSYGRRNNILITREDDNSIKTYRVDLTQSDFINSDFYYLKQNDIIYVEPNKTRINSSAVGPNVSIYMTAISLLITTTALILTNTRK
ncbi:MAG TPA: polysaccharide biosynthesis/export family protein [Flavobacterium sp.]|nr:polysaccharide biosynthesis/export family protein [Flavobacterium sp.]